MDRPQGRMSIFPALTSFFHNGEDYCEFCKLLDLNLIHHQYSNEGSFGVRDAFLGCRSSLQSRSAGCLSCKAIIAIADEHVASLDEFLKESYQTDYEFSAHFMDEAPKLWIAFGETGTPKEDVSARRKHLTTLGIIWLFSHDDEITKATSVWPLGKPQLFDPAQVDTGRILQWLQQCESCHDQKCQTFNTALSQSDVRPCFIDVQQECIVTPNEDLATLHSAMYGAR